jgi:hypothetical protein
MVCMLLLVPVCVCADELKLKDGAKIVGTIVGFEDNSFKVKTSYGYALVQRDQIVSISMADSAKKPEPSKQSDVAKQTETEKKTLPAHDQSAKPAESRKTEAVASSASQTAPAQEGKSTAAAVDVSPATVPTATKPASATAKPSSISSANASSATVSPAPASTPAAVPSPAASPKPLAPEPIREEVSGNLYVNETYGFRMYKPPDWELIAGARTLLPGAIAAMGTGDQNTYLLIGQDAAGKSLASDMEETEAHLRDVMDNFRGLGEKRITISGSQAIERRFRGSVDQRDWSGTVVLVPRGAEVYTIFGMTYADTDLVQIQENVISRAISSLQFTKP